MKSSHIQQCKNAETDMYYCRLGSSTFFAIMLQPVLRWYGLEQTDERVPASTVMNIYTWYTNMADGITCTPYDVSCNGSTVSVTWASII